MLIMWWLPGGNQIKIPKTPVMRVSDDNGETFGPTLILAVNGTIDVESAEEHDSFYFKNLIIFLNEIK